MEQPAPSSGETLEFALRYADNGLSVFPLHHAINRKCSCGDDKCESIAKHPRTANGVKNASRNQEQIQRWWQQWPQANIGIALDGYVVIDVDPRNGGDSTLRGLIEQHGELPDTWHARTGGGGDHYFLKARPNVKYRGALGAGVDLKHSGGGYVVVEPSIHATGEKYVFLDESGPLEDGALALAPEWLGTIHAATEYASPRAESIISGGRNNFLYERARRLRDLSLRHTEILSAITAINAERCHPPLSEQELRTIARSAYQNEPDTPSNGDRFIDIAPFVASIEPPVWIVDKIIQRSYLYALTALTNHGKTAVATALALAVCAGDRFAGQETEPGRVLYLCGENPEDFKLRLRGAMQSMSLKPDRLAGKFTVFPVADRLAGLRETLTEQAAVNGYSLVVADTSAAYFSYEEENDNIAARSHAQDLRWLITLPGAPAVLALCHPTKNAQQDAMLPRGGSGFLNEIDCNLTLWKDDDTATLSYTKVRGPGFQPTQFALERVHVTGVLDAKGRTMETIVASHINDSTAQQRFDGLEADEIAIMNSIGMLVLSVADIARRSDMMLTNSEPNKNRVFRRLSGLKERGMVEQTTAKKYQTTKKGRNKFSL